MKQNGSLEIRMKAMARKASIEVKTPKERAEAHRVAMRNGFGITTHAKPFGGGYLIFKN